MKSVSPYYHSNSHTMHIYFVWIFLSIYFLSLSLHAQKKSGIDSLHKVIQTYKEPFFPDSLGKAYLALSRLYQVQSNYEEAIQSLVLATSLNPSDEIYFEIHSELGHLCTKQSNYLDALNYLNLAEKRADRVEDTLQIDNDVRLAQLYVNVGDYEKASAYQYEALLKAEKMGHAQRIIMGYVGLGRIYWYTKNLNEALNFFLKSLSLAEQQEDPHVLFRSISGVASSYSEKEELSEALKYAQRALRLADSLDHSSYQAFSQGLVGEILRKQKRLPTAKVYFNNAIQNFKEIGSPFMFADVLMRYGQLLYEEGNKQNAIDTLQAALQIAKAISYRSLQCDLYKEISDYYHNVGAFQKAYTCFQLHTKLQDSLMNQKLQNRIKQIEARYIFDNQERLIVDLERKERNMRLTIVIISCILSLLLLLVIYRIFILRYLKFDTEKTTGLPANRRSLKLSVLNHTLAHSLPESRAISSNNTSNETDKSNEADIDAVFYSEAQDNQSMVSSYEATQFSDTYPSEFSSIIFESYKLLSHSFQTRLKSIRIHGLPKVKKNAKKLFLIFSKLLSFLNEAFPHYQYYIDILLEKEDHHPYIILVQIQLESLPGRDQKDDVSDISIEQEELSKKEIDENLQLLSARKLIELVEGNWFPLDIDKTQITISFSLPRIIFD